MTYMSVGDANTDELFKALNAEVTWLFTTWELFTQLYASSDENFDIMNATAPQFFGILKTILFDEMVMVWNRLTDPPRLSKQANATLESLIEKIDHESQAILVASLRLRLERIRTNYKAFRQWRNKVVSHNDLALALRKEGAVMPGITRMQAENAIKEVADFMNEYSLGLFDSEQKYVPFMVAQGDAKALLRHLKDLLDSKSKRV